MAERKKQRQLQKEKEEKEKEEKERAEKGTGNLERILSRRRKGKIGRSK